MRTSQECLAKANELHARAVACSSQDMAGRFQYLSDCWRDLADDASPLGASAGPCPLEGFALNL